MDQLPSTTQQINLHALVEPATYPNGTIAIQGLMGPSAAYSTSGQNVRDLLDSALRAADHLKEPDHGWCSGVVPTKMNPS